MCPGLNANQGRTDFRVGATRRQIDFEGSGLGLECYLLGVYCLLLVYISFLKLHCTFNVVYEIGYIELQFKNSLRLKALLTLYR